jgi:citronellyl-CoA dehydrogenase
VAGRSAPLDTVLLMVDRAADGVGVGSALATIGHRSMPCHDVHFEDVFVPDAARIGEEGLGAMLQVAQFVTERVLSSARANGAAAAMLDELWDYSQERKARGGPLSREPRVRAEVARLRSLVQRSRAMTATAADTVRRGGGDVVEASSVAKFISSRAVREVGRYAAHLQGARAYVGLLRGCSFYADSRLYSISTGSDEMMLHTIARTQKFYAFGPRSERS